MSLIPPQSLPPAPLGQRRTGRKNSSRPSTAVLEPLVPIHQPSFAAATEITSNKQALSSGKGFIDQQQQQLQSDEATSRPMSGHIRPLSSRVYIRRTVKKGWVAKGINEEEEEDNDELSDNGSLDSFFDDDFDDTTQTQALKGFLSCNTLGVESKGSKNDWVAGDIAIPKFHCPRCRDHWYGICSAPCDEELARLIREGKWYTDKEGSQSQQDSNGKARNQKVQSTSGSGNESTSSSKLPSIRRRVGTGINRGNSARNIDFIDPKAKDKSKRNRKISFKLDSNTESELDNSGSSGLLQDGQYEGNGRNRTKYTNKAGDGLSDNDRAVARNIDSSSSASDMNSSSSTTLLRGGANSKTRGGKSKAQLDSLNNKEDMSKFKGDKDGGSRTGKTSGSKTDLLASNRKGGGFGDEMDSDKNSRGKKNCGNISGSEETKHSSGNGVDTAINGGTGRGNQQGLFSHDGGDNGLSSNEMDGGKGGTIHNGTGLDKSNKRQGNNATSGSQNSSRYGSRASSLHGGSQRWSEYGDEGSGNGKSRKDKELVSGKGYMRASSPSQSDWGDPTHAKAWLSNTASSSRVSLAQQGSRDKDDIDVDEVVYLPPINNKHKNPFASDDLLDGFSLTRAFTFSYF